MPVNLNKQLAAIDRWCDRQSLPVIRRALREMLKSGELKSLDDDLYWIVQKAMVAAHMRGLLYVNTVLADIKLSKFGDLSANEKKSLNALYASIARSASDQTTAAIRDKMVEDVQQVATGRGKRKSLKTVFKQAGISRENPALVKTLMRTQTSLAFNAAAYSSTQDNDKVWGYEYVTAGDDLVRDTHQQLAGARYPKDAPFWDIYTPPCGWNCRCGLDVIKTGDKRARTKPIRKPPMIDPEFRFNPGKLVTQ